MKACTVPNCCLIEGIQAGDRTAEAEFVSRFSRGLFLKLRRLTGDSDLAEDLCQETLALFLVKIRRGELREPESAGRFIYSMAYNLFIADRRKEARYSPLPMDENANFLALSLEALSFDRIAAEERAREVQQILSELRFDRDRQLLLRFYLQDQSKEEVCRDLEIEPERFNLVLHRARRRLRALWNQRVSERRLPERQSSRKEPRSHGCPAVATRQP